jgi:hypothetical protein
VLDGILQKKQIDDELKNLVEAALKEFGSRFTGSKAAAVA